MLISSHGMGIQKVSKYKLINVHHEWKYHYNHFFHSMPQEQCNMISYKVLANKNLPQKNISKFFSRTLAIKFPKTQKLIFKIIKNKHKIQ